MYAARYGPLNQRKNPWTTMFGLITKNGANIKNEWIDAPGTQYVLWENAIEPWYVGGARDAEALLYMKEGYTYVSTIGTDHARWNLPWTVQSSSPRSHSVLL